jgi:hypothetical protein
VLTRIADDDEQLQLIFKLDNATNARLRAEENLSPGISLADFTAAFQIYGGAWTRP